MLNSEILDRLPPHDLDAERQVLGAAIMDPGICDELGALLSAEDFYSDAHGKLYDVLIRMHDTSTPISTSSLVGILRQRGDLEAIGGTAALAEIVQSVAVARHYAYHAGIVVEHARRRQMIHAAAEVLRDCYDKTQETTGIINRAEAAFSQVVPGGGPDVEPQPINEVMVDVLQHIDEVQARGEGIGIATGFSRFDEQIGGLFPSEMTVLAARPGVGKTAMACQISTFVGGRRPVYFASLEMSRREITTRMLCTEAEVDSQHIRTASLSGAERERLTRASQHVASTQVILDPRPTMSVMDIRRAARKVHRKEGGLGLVVVDYLTVVTPPDETKKRYEQVGDIARRLKALAEELDIPVLVLAQLKREVDGAGKNGKPRQPRMADLRESGEIEQVADCIIFLHREAIGYRAKDSRTAELLMEKNRNGVTKGYKLLWEPTFTRYTEAPQSEEEAPEPEPSHWSDKF